MKLHVLDVLVRYSHSLVHVLILDDLVVLGSEESLLQLNSLPVGPDQLLHLILQAVHAASHLVAVPQRPIKLCASLLN
jgi:hypothetical protein